MSLDPKVVLVVEDDRAIRETLAEILVIEGYRVLTAVHGAQAMRHLKAGERPSLIILDLMMPVMDGFEFRAKQLKSEDYKQIPVLIISADQNGEYNKSVLKVDHYMVKPLETDS